MGGSEERTPGAVCVYCRRRAVVPTWRPFCSERCKLLDLRNWVDERYRVPGDTATVPEEDPFSDGTDADEGKAHDDRHAEGKQR